MFFHTSGNIGHYIFPVALRITEDAPDTVQLIQLQIEYD